MAGTASRPDFSSLVALMHRLRAPGGCPWDAEQDHTSLRPYLVEETYEVLDAIDSHDDPELCDELGDVLLQVLFHAELAAERGAFTIDDVIAGLSAKLIRRHPHVFADTVVLSSQEVVANWARIKASERGAGPTAPPSSALDGVASGLPSLMRAHRLGERAARVGFDWNRPEGARAKVSEELTELDAAIDSSDPAAIAHELGDVLLATVNLARLLRFNAELLVRDATMRFERRFRHMEAALAAEGLSMEETSPEELDERWQRAKAESAADQAGRPSAARGPRR